ncbi:MAG TPA: PEP-CTERM sorting domain-containing protein [Gemmatales bacterium]|nr:PEP-CTERM sorting domain-containing protein [Gemmatales bacterium]HMP17368.1 PEP-CTERM sorting domain-containing protein [Gemmatales bacterium]
MLTRLLLTIFTAITCSSITQAQITTFFGDSNAFPRDLSVPQATQTSFLSSFANTGTDDFESYAIFSAPPVYTIPSVGVTYTADFTFVNANAQGFNLSVSGSQFVFGNGDPFGNGISLTNSIVFSTPVNGFGMFFVNVGDSVANSFTIALQEGAGGTPRVYPINASGDGTGNPLNFSGRNGDATFYFGIRDTTPFDRVTITASSNQDGIVFDDLSVGFIAAVPEPTTYALVGIVLAGAGSWYVRKSREQYLAFQQNVSR